MSTKVARPGGRKVLRWLLVLLVIGLALVTVPSQAAPVRHAPATQSFGTRAARAVAEPPHQETQAERDRMTVRLRITPADVTATIGERVRFAANAEDGAGRPVGGVAFTWRVERVSAPSDLAISDDGQLTATACGKYRVVAEGAGQRGEAIVQVVPASEPGSAAPATLTPGVAAAQVIPVAAPGGRPGLLPPREPTWASRSRTAANDPNDRRGANPLDKVTPSRSGGVVDNSGAGSGNARFSLPLLNLPGRGIDLSLALTYNSQLWNRVGDEMAFTPVMDDDWPAPGWTLGFGKVVGSILIDADGDRHVLSDPRVLGDLEVRYSTDGSLIKCYVRRYEEVWRQDVDCYYPDGSHMEFDQFTASAVSYPTRITDVDGNQVTIQYWSDSDPAIRSIQDTLGRTITFHYQQGGYVPDRGALTAVTAPGLNGGVRTLARFNWGREQFHPSFGGGLKLWPTSTSYPHNRILLAMYYPDTKAGYWLHGAYNNYGMIESLDEHRDMSFDGGPLGEQGVIHNGRTVHKVTYNYPVDLTRTEPPTYTQTTEIWEGMSTAPAVTEYHLTRSQLDVRNLTITYPDGHRQITRESDGKPWRVETLGSDGAPLFQREMIWEDGEPYWSGGPKPPRLKRVETEYPDVGLAKVEYAYDRFNQVTDVREYDYDATTVRRRTHMEYEGAPEYRARHIFGLVNLVETFDGETGDPATRTQIKHDGQAMSPTPGIVQQDRAFDPGAPLFWVPPTCETDCTPPCDTPQCGERCEWVCRGSLCQDVCTYSCDPCNQQCSQVCHGTGHYESQYDQRTAFRGHVTRVYRYAKAADLSEPVRQRFRYDLAGNLVSVRSSCCEWGGVSYTSATQYAYPEQRVLGEEDPSSPDRLILHSSYDFNTGIPLSATDADGLTTLLDSSPETLRPKRVQYPGGASTTFDYDDRLLTVSTTTRPMSAVVCCPPSQAPATEAQVGTAWLDGRGMPIRQAQRATNGWDVTEVRYDELGRPVYMSDPARRSGEPSTWAAPEHWHIIGRDGVGRVTSMQEPDGGTTLTRYNQVQRPRGAGDKPGPTTLTFDPSGRWRWSRTDVLDRLVEMVEPAPDGDGSLDGASNLVTTYDYDPVGLVRRITQGGQERLFEHDSLGRLRRQALPEKDRTLNAAGELVGAGGTWSDVFGYDDRSHLTSIVDARGVRTNYDYGDDPLGRLQQLSYTLPPSAKPDSITSVGDSHFAYKPTGDIARIRSIATDGVGVQTYDYDPDTQRVISESMHIADWPDHPLAVDATYDSLGRMTMQWNPAKYGVRLPRVEDRRQVSQTYDSVGRPETTSMRIFPDSAGLLDVASVLSYSPAGQVEMSRAGPTGPGEIVESYGFDQVTGLPSGQKVTRGSEPLLDLSYDFTQVGNGHPDPGRMGQLTAMRDNLHPERGLRYSYDRVGRLNSVSQDTPGTPGWSQTYDYDRYGNRTAVRVTAPGSPGQAVLLDGHATTPVDEGSNRLAIAGYMYDAAGNLTRSKEGGAWLRYRYDAAGRLAAVLTDQDTELESYIYGFDGKRLETRHATGPVDRTIYAWGGGQVFSEYTRERAKPGQPQDVPRWSRDNIYQLGRLVATAQPSQNGQGPDLVRYLHSDRTGIRLVTGPGATETAEQVNLPFGAAAMDSTDLNPRFTSYDRSPTTGLDYAVNRFYSPSHGRFTQPDPSFGSNAGDPQALNLYTYARNDPINNVDPSGLCELRKLSYEGEEYQWCAEDEVVVTGCYSCMFEPKNYGLETFIPCVRGCGGLAREEARSVGRPASPSRMSLQESIFRALGGKGPFTPAPRPTTGLDAMAIATLAVPAAAAATALTAGGALFDASVWLGVKLPWAPAAGAAVAAAAGVPSSPNPMRLHYTVFRGGRIIAEGLEFSGPGGDLGHAEMGFLQQLGHLLQEGDTVLLQGENALCGRGYCNIALSETARTVGVDILYYSFTPHAGGALTFFQAFVGHVPAPR